ncbi:uncharacterized protein METZ01_LOCUS505913, partial [marine metagenome]
VEVSDSIEIQFIISDSTSDLITIVPEYSINEGTTWDTANVVGILDDLADSVYTGTIIWPSHVQAEGTDQENLKFRITPHDIDSGDNSVISFHLDNNRLPAIELVDFAAEEHDVVLIDYVYSDDEDDTHSIELFFSLDGGYSWLNGTVQPYDPSGDLEWYMWLTEEDLPDREENNVQLIVIPYDNDMGTSDTSNVFALDNYQGQSVILDPIAGEQADSVQIFYSITDTTNDQI